MSWKNVLLGLAVAVFFSALFLLNVSDSLEDQVYDLLLRFRAERERALSPDVVFLDVDDGAIAYNGVFPWPRSVTAEGLLRLKEYGARTAIFDIEYIDKGPPGVDAVYLDQGLGRDFDRSFSEVGTMASEVFNALYDGRMNRADIPDVVGQFDGLLNSEHDTLFARSQSVARDNDEYMIQASALFGKSWVTLNLRDPEQPALEGEQAERRAMAEELFSYKSAASNPLKALPDACNGDYIGILPALSGFSNVAAGAGFTNVEIDEDGTRRRIDLAQNINDHWYLQLAFAPLMNHLGNPELELDSRTMRIKGARMPGGITKDITIPLDGKGRMLLDWPKEDYTESYNHISFQNISLLEDIESELESYALAFGQMDTALFDPYDDSPWEKSLLMIPFIVGDLSALFDAARASKAAALESCSEEEFENMVNFRAQARARIQELLDIDPETKVQALAPELAAAFPDDAAYIQEQADNIAEVAAGLKLDLERYVEVSEKLKATVRDKFCILGRSDTGTTDYGATPFHGNYVNVGTHGVVIDMILNESFISPVGTIWQVLFTITFMFLFFLASSKIAPVTRVISGFLATVLIIAGSACLLRFAGIFVNPLLATFSMVVAVILREIVSYAGSEREKQFIRKAFSTYVSDDIVKEIIADPSRLQLGGAERHMSAIFTDIQGFSGISEQLDPESLVKLLNLYLTLMSDAVLAKRGTIDKYEGDAIVAFFGAPLEIPDHALRACASAIEMKKIEHELNRKIADEKLSPKPLLTRIGINTGSMVAGNMGTDNKMNYTIMGSAVNLAARLEGANKQYGTWILATDDTIRETNGEILTRRVDRVRVVGISEPVLLHEVINTAADAGPEEKKLVEVFHQALSYYENRKWQEAAEGFRESLAIEKTGPSAKYIERCQAFIKYPPHDTWDGVTNLTEK